MSAWLAFAMLGFYPAQPFSGENVTGSPMVDAARLQLGAGRTLTVRGRGMQARWNGGELPSAHIRHDALSAGGTLQFR